VCGGGSLPNDSLSVVLCCRTTYSVVLYLAVWVLLCLLLAALPALLLNEMRVKSRSRKKLRPWETITWREKNDTPTHGDPVSGGAHARSIGEG
jgi:hypothetical protein